MNHFPDRCLAYLNKIGISFSGPYDLSDSIFSGMVKCFSIQAVFNGKNIIGIGVDENEYSAASKCLSEFLEKLLIGILGIRTDIGVCGTAFHYDADNAHHESKKELFERVTLALLGLRNTNRIQWKEEHPSLLPNLVVLQQEFQERFFRLEYFPDFPVYYVELRQGEFIANGFASYTKDETLTWSKAFLESYRRLKVFMANKETLKKSITEFLSESPINNSYSLHLNQIEEFFHQIDDLGFFALRSIRNLPSGLDIFIHSSPINAQPLKKKGKVNEQLQKTTDQDNCNGQNSVGYLLKKTEMFSN